MPFSRIYLWNCVTCLLFHEIAGHMFCPLPPNDHASAQSLHSISHIGLWICQHLVANICSRCEDIQNHCRNDVHHVNSHQQLLWEWQECCWLQALPVTTKQHQMKIIMVRKRREYNIIIFQLFTYLRQFFVVFLHDTVGTGSETAVVCMFFLVMM